MAAALTLDGVSKRYGDFQAVRDLSFAVEKGTICGFLGPNGAGKTSTIRMILGLQGVTAGRIGILAPTMAARCVTGSASCRRSAASTRR
jgi:ABC-2 type transport system ATP-binding protein